MTSTKRNSVYVFILLWLVPSNQFSYMIRKKALLIEKKKRRKTGRFYPVHLVSHSSSTDPDNKIQIYFQSRHVYLLQFQGLA